MAAGFGAVFGTPLAGAVFAIEVPTIGRLSLQAFFPCLLAAIAGDQVAQAWGTQHTAYSIVTTLNSVSALNCGPLSLLLRFLLLACAGSLFGLCSRLFIEMLHKVSQGLSSSIAKPWLRPVAGGAAVIVLTLLTGTRDYLGLGVSASPQSPGSVTILSCFCVGGADWFSWWWKSLFTAVTVGSGFKGGEVTPLFFIGAALGHSLGRLTGMPVDEMAGLGFVAVFAGATNTPIASIILAIELFAPHSPNLLQSGFPGDVAVVCGCAWLFSGQNGIYKSQRVGSLKTPQSDPDR
jgi:H+/Cl- antiporter ClcA